MKHRLLSVRMVAYLFLGLCCLELAGQSASAWRESFDRGLMQEEIHDNPEQAIEHYRSVVEAFDEERDLIAMSIYRLAECLRKTDNLDEALPLYQRIVNEFGDRESLALLSRRFVPEQNEEGGTLLIDDPGLLRTLIGQLEDASPVIALQSLAQMTGDLTAASLIERHLQGEEKVVALSTRYRDGWPPLREERARLEAIKGQMERHIGGALSSLEAQLARLEGVASAEETSSPEIKKFADDPVTLRLFIDELEEANQDVALQLLARETGSAVAARLQDERIAIQLEVSSNLNKYGPEHPEMIGARNRLKTVDELAADHISLETKQLEAKLRILEKARSESPFAKGVEKEGLITEDLADPELIRLAELQRIAIEKPDLLTAESDGLLPPLHRAAREGHRKIVRFLLDSGVDVNNRDKVGKSPLHLAVEKGDLGMTEFLLAEEECDIEAREPFHSTPLHVAVEKGFYSVAKALVDAGADVNASSLQRAEIRHEGAIHSIEPSRRLGFQFSTESDNRELTAVYPYLLTEGNTPLHLSVVAGFDHLTELLLSHDANVNATNRCHLTPLLHYLAHSRAPVPTMVKTVRNLLDEGADARLSGIVRPRFTSFGRPLSKTGSSYFTPGYRPGSQYSAKLWEEGPWKEELDFDESLPNSWTSPLHLAVLMDDGLARLLIEHGADFAQLNHSGETPLHVLMRVNRESEFLRHLETLEDDGYGMANLDQSLFPGLDPLVKNVNGFRAVDFALELPENHRAAHGLSRLVPEESRPDYAFQTFWTALMTSSVLRSGGLDAALELAGPAGDVLNTLGPENLLPLEFAVLKRGDFPSLAAQLLEHGAEPVLTPKLSDQKRFLQGVSAIRNLDRSEDVAALELLNQLEPLEIE